ncbi:UDPglucose 6-dehydrogenase [Paenibacillus sp. UNC496MF]|uniref:UDP-glucose dehydrogenase family protein n=1 Tax=Paenibacillus sp. UNC496MF TaxID=1502753 RepID=UPI0008EABB53|nr:UDP-glucose/GDP-mannose dehydrogenase family protein [Paenibacillus sp. UNC496MF]SFI89325.1 UDPglucose 6-dehydrogenase [Paenibacillus sp. UNC496MF]
MRITVVGTGYVGLVSGTCFAELGHDVVCVDKDQAKIALLTGGDIPIHEPGLRELVERNAEAGRLGFTTDLGAAVERAEAVILAVGTPSLPNGEADLTHLEGAVREIASAMNAYKLIMTKSTVPVGTNARLRALLASLTGRPFDIVSVPEFLREGSAVKDTFHPDRIVVGADREEAGAAAAALHRPLTDRIFVTDVRSAEMIKYASNAFLATKISFINEIANICEKVGADVEQVAAGMGLDNRIGSSFLKAGIGYGGSCFPKDARALIQIAGNVDYEFKLLKSVVDVNRDQRFGVVRKLRRLYGDLAGRTIAVWGLAFKPNTDDVRESPAVDIVAALLDLGAHVRACDPIALPNFRSRHDHERIAWCGDALEAAQGADAVCLLTEWPEFAAVDLGRLRQAMRQPVLIDGRNQFDAERLEGAGFAYSSIGRPALNREEGEAAEPADAQPNRNHIA